MLNYQRVNISLSKNIYPKKHGISKIAIFREKILNYHPVLSNLKISGIQHTHTPELEGSPLEELSHEKYTPMMPYEKLEFMPPILLVESPFTILDQPSVKHIILMFGINRKHKSNISQPF
jgi:hypothetical protein